jgi:hypothetical protein
MIELWIIIGLPVLIIALLTNAWQLRRSRIYHRNMAVKLIPKLDAFLAMQPNIEKLLKIFERMSQAKPKPDNVLTLKPNMSKLNVTFPETENKINSC